MRTIILTILVVASAACDRAPPIATKRLPSPDGRLELVVWAERSEGILDGNMLFTVDTPHATFDNQKLVAHYKRARNPVFYWTDDGRIAFIASELHGTIISGRGNTEIVQCGLGMEVCEKLLPPADGTTPLHLETYTSGESPPFEAEN